MGNTVSDLMYPDNPNRRKRAEGLRQDILQLVQDFEREKSKKEELFNKVKEELDAVLHKLGVKTRDELDKYIRDNMKNDADLKAYDNLRQSIDKWDQTANIIVDIVGLVGVGTFVVGSLAALVGIITFSAAVGALEIVAGLAAAAGLVVVVLSIYEGAVQREKLREAIHTMLEKRTEAFQYVQRMRILNTWARSIVNELQKGKTFDDLKDLLQEGLKEPWDQCTLHYCQEKLRETDIERGAWMDEDGRGYFYSSVGVSRVSKPANTDGKVPRVELSFTPLDTGVCQSVTLMLQGAISSSVCVATSGQDTWFLRGKPVEDVSELEAEQYDLERVPEGKTGAHDMYRACRLKVNSLSFV
ncbi:hypothetical protein F5X99DRAFT_400599 [Biscogniauxia marginata]|nr:hypothetical protein F5X99DRAFT_400599 [Biscogniauxia marginata]